MPTLRVQLIAALTVLSVLLPGTAFVRTHYFCGIMNRVVSTCCCESSRDADSSCGPQVRAADCCQKITTGNRSAAAPTSETDFSVPVASIAEAPAQAVYALPPRFVVVALPVQARAPPAIGPPLFIAHCSILT